jgi:hypothetical protein
MAKVDPVAARPGVPGIRVKVSQEREIGAAALGGGDVGNQFAHHAA